MAFFGNQVRVQGHAGPNGGLADVYLDGVKQPAGIDCWCPLEWSSQLLFYKNGLSNTTHELEIAARGLGNPASQGKTVSLDTVQWSSATGDSGFGEGGGPHGHQRWIMGFAGRDDYIDSEGNAWRPATELVTRTGANGDSVAAHWWTDRQRFHIANTTDPELYRYGVHGGEFFANVTVGPGNYHVRLRFAETRSSIGLPQRAVAIAINGIEKLKDLDIEATAGGLNRAVDLVFDDIAPQNGVIEIRLSNSHGGEAILQALEVGPGPGGEGAKPVFLPPDGTEK
jgi:hypothetical protein